MRKIRFGRTELKVSELAFGGIPIQRVSTDEAVEVVRTCLELGINFIDTAHGYSTSEERIGEALKGYAREEIIIASKSPATDRDGFMRDLELSLKRLDTDYIDIYQHHNVGSDENMERILAPGGAREGMEEALRQGLIRHPAFSAHSLETAEKMMRLGWYEALQIPFNFVDSAAAEAVLPLAAELDMGVIAMKPLGGGLIGDAQLCFRYLRQFPGIVPDPGIETGAEIREIVSVWSDDSPLTPQEKESIEETRRRLGSSWCHRCDYCRPCPQEIPISSVLTSTSMLRRMPLTQVHGYIDAAMAKAADCTGCGECEERCPYDLPIPELIRQRRREYTGIIAADHA